MGSALLSDRAIVAVSGEDAETLLNRLITSSVSAVRGYDSARYAALLSPQGKILFDFLVCRGRDALWLDCRRDQAADLVRKLTMYRLRAKAVIAVKPDLAVAADWGGRLLEAPGICFRDPRHNNLGIRIVASVSKLAFFDQSASDYCAHRIGLGVPEGGTDWVYGDTFLHDANFDLLHGVDFDKGCYVGQEVVSRVHHRASARKRIVHVKFLGEPQAVGTELLAGEVRLGQLTSLAGHEGLASARIDRLTEVASAASPITVGGTLVEIRLAAARPVVPAVDDTD